MTDLSNKHVQENLTKTMAMGVPFLGVYLAERVESLHLCRAFSVKDASEFHQTYWFVRECVS